MASWQNSKTEVEITGEVIEQDKVTLEICPSRDLFQFQGHFPEYPILPGVAQLDWAVRLAARYFNTPIVASEIAQLKYRQFIMPETKLSLSLEYDRQKGQVKFNYQNQNKQFSSGIVRFDDR